MDVRLLAALLVWPWALVLSEGLGSPGGAAKEDSLVPPPVLTVVCKGPYVEVAGDVVDEGIADDGAGIGWEGLATAGAGTRAEIGAEDGIALIGGPLRSLSFSALPGSDDACTCPLL